MLSKYRNSANSVVIGIAAFALIGLSLILTILPLGKTIVMLNGIYAGSVIGIIFAYWRLIAATVIGDPPFDRARQYALGTFFLWSAYTATVFISIIVRASGGDPAPYMIVAGSRWIAIIAAWLQVTAPDFGDGFFGSADRKVLWIAVLISATLSVLMIVFQESALLSL